MLVVVLEEQLVQALLQVAAQCFIVTLTASPLACHVPKRGHQK